MDRTYEVFYKPRTGDEMARAVPGANVLLYSDICNRVALFGVGRVLYDLFQRSPLNIILLQDPDKMNTGHWMGLVIKPEKREIYFFSSYGGKPDFEKNKWLPQSDRIRSSQNINALNDGLKMMAKNGWTVHYNQYKYQREGDGTATCGIWTAAFLRSGMNPDEFHDFTMRRCYDPYSYYRMLFSD